MPKDRGVGSLSFERSRVSPYPCSSRGRDTKQCQHENQSELGFGSIEKVVKEWEDARCPICMEHPHNAVLLRCSSSDKGCRPFMCNTSYRHSNCLDQFCKSSVSSPSTALLQEIPLGNMASASNGLRNMSDHPTEAGSESKPKLLCPLCRGEIYGWSVVESARQFMNSKARSCAMETCDFIGVYSELRKHARSAHPLVRPSEVDPERQRDWTRLERDRDYEDMLSSIQSVPGEGNGENLSELEDFRSWLTINLAYLTLALEFISDSRNTEQDSFRRRSGSRRFRYGRESNNGTRENGSSVPDRELIGHRNNPSSEERLPGRHRGSQGTLQWRNRSTASNRGTQERHQSSQADRTRRGQGGLRWRTPRWSSFNNGQ